MKIAVVILNWNGKNLLEQFLPSVIEFSSEASIYVADNASTDTSIPYLKEHFPTIKIIENKENGGYAQGYNDALKQVKEEVYCLLNSDVEVTDGWLHPIVKLFNSNSSIAAIQPKIKDFKNKTHFEYAGAAGGFIDKFGYPYCRGRIFDTLEEDYGQYNDSIPVFWATGACLFVKADVFNSLGGFDIDFFAHQEEIDLCWRIQNSGYSVYYCGLSTVYHVGGATLSQGSPEKSFLNFRNGLYLLLKNLPTRQLIPIIFFRMMLDGVAGIRFLTKGETAHFKAILRAHFSFYRNLALIYKKRCQPRQNQYFRHFSIVWNYFVMKRRKFSDL